MFGYRLIRESDYDAIRSMVAEVSAELMTERAAHIAVLRELVEAKSAAAAQGASVAHLTVSANTAQKERAIWQAKITGMPAIAPEIVGTGNPLAAQGIGEGVDLFQDVGDRAAHQMAELGLINGSERSVFPGAASLTESASQE